ncbi:hypothetical protein J4417_00680 [Candidatus Woesearchaeota archaeon]|nr:hypothetical protein [Candidatus Woesearchaeota archaeon]
MKGKLLGYLSAGIFGATIPSVANGLAMSLGGECYPTGDTVCVSPLRCYTTDRLGINLQCVDFIYESAEETRYEIRIEPEDSWESLTEDLMIYEPDITIDKLVGQASKNSPLCLNLRPEEILIYIVKKNKKETYLPQVERLELGGVISTI